MTVFGIDISNNNGPDIDLTEVAREGFDFVFAKVSEGDYFTDATWPAYRDAARAAGLLLAGYHYLRADCDIEAQAQLFTDHLGDAAAMIDFEANSGGISTFWAFVAACNRRGRQIALSYIPRWYANQIGAPDLSAVPGLIQSAYVSGTGPASALYPGDDSQFWAGFCGRDPDLLQFTDAAQVAGHVVDANAFRGSRADLAALLGDPSPTEGDPVSTPIPGTPADLAVKVEEIWAQLRGPDGAGWAQLGHNESGANLTLVDAVAALRADMAQVLTLLRPPTPTPAAGVPVDDVKAAS